MVEKTIPRVPRIERARVIKVFRLLGYSEDINNPNITVLRQTDFPFRRITLPNNAAISTELIRLFLIDLRIEFDLFYHLLENQQG